MRQSSDSFFRVALQKSQLMASFRPPMFFLGGASGQDPYPRESTLMTPSALSSLQKKSRPTVTLNKL